MRRVVLALVLVAVCSPAAAGGTSVPVQMLELVETGTDEYVLTYKTLHTKEYEFENLPRNTVLTVQLRFSRLRYLSKSDLLTIEKYRRLLNS